MDGESHVLVSSNNSCLEFSSSIIVYPGNSTAFPVDNFTCHPLCCTFVAPVNYKVLKY